MPHDSTPPVSASAAESSGLNRRDFLKTVGCQNRDAHPHPENPVDVTKLLVIY
jgi:hypothetical protein